MKRKIISILLLIFTAIILVSCVEVAKHVEYESSSPYETKIIETAKKIENTSVTLVYDYITTDSNGNEKTKEKAGASAVVVDIENQIGTKIVTAITTADLLMRFDGNLRVLPIRTNRSIELLDYAYNEKYDFAVIKFETKAILKPVSIDTIYNYSVGQSIITIGTTEDVERFNSTKVGVITNDNLEYNEHGISAFMHDAPNNPGEKGSGIFDLDGNLIGLNGVNYYKSGDEYVSGMTLAIKARDFLPAISNLSKIDYKNNNISDELFNSVNLEEKAYNSNLEYENKLISLNETLKDTIVSVGINNPLATELVDIATGLVYAKDNAGNYWIITKKYESFNNLEIYYKNTKLEILDSHPLEEYYLSLHKVSTTHDLKVYNSNTINEGIGNELVEGQTLISISAPLGNKYYNNFNVATLSKKEYGENFIFMHEGVLNNGQSGSPLFNLNGDLIGFNFYKINEIETQTGPISAEGLNYAINLNYAAAEINKITLGSSNILNLIKNWVNSFKETKKIKSYDLVVDYEKQIIDVVNMQSSNTVTVKTGNGHGSGVIFKKVKQSNGNYLYSVLTNEHVVSGKSPLEVYIVFNDEREEIFAKDFVNASTYDLAVVRFESKEEYTVTNSKAVNEQTGINPLKGQTAIAIGTPEANDRSGYVSTGNITTPAAMYGIITKLAVNHNASLNPGNSGGPLFNLNGELIALNVSKMVGFNTYAGFIQSEGIGTSLNINVLSPIINSFKELDYIKVEKTPRMGITVSDLIAIPEEEQHLLPAVTEGVVAVDTDPLKDAHGKIFKYDVITHIDGVKINRVAELALRIQGKRQGEEVSLTVLRLENGITKTLTIKIVFK